MPGSNRRASRLRKSLAVMPTHRRRQLVEVSIARTPTRSTQGSPDSLPSHDQQLPSQSRTKTRPVPRCSLPPPLPPSPRWRRPSKRPGRNDTTSCSVCTLAVLSLLTEVSTRSRELGPSAAAYHPSDVGVKRSHSFIPPATEPLAS